MAQAAIHGLVGVGLGRLVARRACRSEDQAALMVGACLGAMGPDIDLFAAIPAKGLGWDDAVTVLHRTATHSLLAVLLVLAAAAVVSPRSRRWSLGLMAAAVGMVLHLFLDVFMWFGSVDLFWPLSRMGVAGRIDLWTWFHPPVLLGRPDLFQNLLDSTEPVLFSLFLLGLRRALPSRGVAAARLRGLSWWAAVAVVWAAASVLLSFVAPRAVVQPLAWAPWMVFAAYVAIQLVRFRHQLVDGPVQPAAAPERELAAR